MLIALTVAATSACASQSNKSFQDSADALEQAADEFERQMTPEERANFRLKTEQSATAEMQASAARCGTSLVFSKEEKFEDRTVWVATGATVDQTACVKRTFPFVKAPSE